jgi:hypothetical protein
MANKNKTPRSLPDQEKLAPLEVFNEEGELVASKEEICILLKCRYNYRDGRASRLKVKASAEILQQLGLLEWVKRDTRKANKDIYICIGHLTHKKLSSLEIVNSLLQVKVLPAGIQIQSKGAKTMAPPNYWRKRDMAELNKTPRT